MKIVFCGSLNFYRQFDELAGRLGSMGFHEVYIPATARRIISGEVTLGQINSEKAIGTFAERTIRDDLIRKHWRAIRDGDAILVVNGEKNGVAGYIGGNTFLEMGFAHVLDQKMFLLNSIPDMPSCRTEIEAFRPVVLDGDLGRLVV
ncbi:hypothetical protein COY93_00645 [Candidatus Uhrbacteria bacterium CG_4_10_14_0_8_um_filter_58_22]|uniref:Maf-like protein n=1 Tax=Candidatus Uhrbacteria bacterium CG_4_10_14_0_8_um_filter_58_22 TaxID=1975029 RepID=A0A2M7QC77_9BACT|nr:MAG: hypothetical protein AUJ19_04195 [Parcubacteria group bacterium CG1_02_58_44]PIY63295.1 MAG: hypothetical protein COY93_00645 [Candidatus Uhrbacteria bacterium CG_4_10_14_0_8_um_filter_58_22]